VSAKGWSGVVHVYPNPNNGHFIISAEGLDAGTSRRVFIEVYNVLGQRIYQNETAPSKARWNYELQLGESAPSGHYNLHLSTSEGASFNIPFLLSK
jgi:hypothetical protein